MVPFKKVRFASAKTHGLFTHFFDRDIVLNCVAAKRGRRVFRCAADAAHFFHAHCLHKGGVAVKRRLFWLVCVCVVLLFLPVRARATATSGTCGANLTWSLDGGVLTISGTGNMRNWTMNNQSFPPWNRSANSIRSVIIQEGATTIGNCAFAYCLSLTSVTISSSITAIGNNAFQGCTGLTSVTIPSSVTAIGNEAFQGCTGLTSVTIPNSVTSMGSLVFFDCTSLTSVTFANGVTNLGTFTFADCTSLTRVAIPDRRVCRMHRPDQCDDS